MLTPKQHRDLLDKAREIRHSIVDVTFKSGGAHIGGGLSMVDILVLLYFHYMNIDVDKPDWDDRDRFVLSKGHGAIGYAPVLANKGFFDAKLLDDFNKFKSPFGMHPDSKRINGCDASTGSLGHGLPIALGMALGARVKKQNFRTYCIVGDGELNEGSIWEATMSAAHFKVDNLTLFVDRNHQMIDGRVKDVMDIEPLTDKFKAFGWNVIDTDGHDLIKLSDAIDQAIAHQNQPTVIIAQTIKGKGVEFMEDLTKWHYGSIDSVMADKAHQSIDKMYETIEI